jgi:hypothetical protein
MRCDGIGRREFIQVNRQKFTVKSPQSKVRRQNETRWGERGDDNKGRGLRWAISVTARDNARLFSPAGLP